jgi:hypothetical protein
MKRNGKLLMKADVVYIVYMFDDESKTFYIDRVFGKEKDAVVFCRDINKDSKKGHWFHEEQIVRVS